MLEEEKKVEDKINILKLTELIDKGKNFLRQEIEKANIVIGCTGSGKSTLINGLVGKQLIIRQISRQQKVIELEQGEQGPKIGHNPVISETSVPELVYDNIHNEIYFDCPGFEDTKSDEQDIANAIFLKQLFENVQNVRIIIVAKEAEFNIEVGRGKLIANFIHSLINLFPEIDKLISSICLIVTKAKPIIDEDTSQIIEPSLEQIIQNLKYFKNQHQISNESNFFKNHNFEKIFNIFLQKQRVQIFKSPIGKDAQKITFSENIYQMINSIPFIKTPQINSSISLRAKEKISKFYNELYEDSQYQGNYYKNLLNYFYQNLTIFQIYLP